MLHDVRLAVRGLRNQPGFAALAILIVALGAGANGAVFSILHAVLLRPLPYVEPDRLVAIAPGSFYSIADIDLLTERARSFTHLASSSPGWMMSLVGVGDPVQIVAARPSPRLLEMLGAQPLHGRLFQAGDFTAGRHRVAVLGYRLWQARFGGDAAAIGRIVTLDGGPYEIIGVLPQAFDVLDPEAEAWVPFDPQSSFARGRSSLAYGRLRPDVDLAAATRELQSLLPEMRQQQGGQADPGQAFHAVPLADVLVGDVRTPLMVVTAAVGLLILLTAANLGTLLLGRQVARQREAAVRSALGATRLRLIRQTVVENVAVAALGAAGGLALAAMALPPLLRLLPPEIPRLDQVAIDASVIGTVLLVTIGAVIVFGVAPSLLATPFTLQPLLRQGAQTEGRAGRRALDLLVVCQLGLAIVLGVAAALMVRSLWALQRVDPGFSPDGVLTLRLQPAGERYRGPGRMLDYYRTVTERVRALPGVEVAGLINHLPLSGYNWSMTVQRDDRPAPQGTAPPRIGWRMIDGPYFDAMRIPLIAGRRFEPADDGSAPLVLIVNESAARRFFDAPEQALGRTLRMSGPTGEQRAVVVGVVGDVRHQSIALPPAPEVYRPVAQTFGMALTLVVRTAGSPAAAGNMVRGAVWSVDPGVAIAGMGPLRSAVRENLGRPRMLATLLFVFAAVGLAIVLCGVYGVVAYTVRRREREMGIRLALGAARSAVTVLVLRQGLRYVVMGSLIGLPAALAAARVLRGSLFGVQPYDVATVTTLCAAIAVTTMLATLIPALGAQRVQPSALLRRDA